GCVVLSRVPHALSSSLHEMSLVYCFFFSSRRRHTRLVSDWSSDVCSSDLSSFFVAPGTTPCMCANWACSAPAIGRSRTRPVRRRSEERRVGKEGRSRWSPYY